MNPPSWTPTTPAITLDQLPAVLSSHPVVVIHFWAIWNCYDRQLDIRLRPVRAAFGDRVAFYAFDVDVDTEAGNQFLRGIHLQGVPTIGCFIHGQLYELAPGMRERPTLEGSVREWLRISTAGA